MTRVRRGSDTVPLSSALRGTKPQHTIAKTMLSNKSEYSLSKGQFIKTDRDGSSASAPSPRRGRAIYSGSATKSIGDSSGKSRGSCSTTRPISSNVCREGGDSENRRHVPPHCEATAAHRERGGPTSPALRGGLVEIPNHEGTAVAPPHRKLREANACCHRSNSVQARCSIPLPAGRCSGYQTLRESKAKPRCRSRAPTRLASAVLAAGP